MKDMEQKIRDAYAHATPDVLRSVLSDCQEQKGTVIVMTQKKKNWAIRAGAIAAALVLVAGLSFGFGVYRAEHTVMSTISLDVNPSIELTVNRKDRVLDATARNKDGEKILSGMELEGSHMDVAVNAILGSMLRNGYLTDVANSILVSVDGKDASRLQEKLTEQIGELLSGSNFTGAVLGQTLTKATALEDLADENNISVGKAQLITQIVADNPRHTFDELAKLSINELTLLSESSKVELETVSATGTASQKGYIGTDAALDAALKDAGTTKSQVTDLEVDMDYEGGKMVYEVEFELGRAEYDYEIHATTGAILRSEKPAKAPVAEEPAPAAAADSKDTADTKKDTAADSKPAATTDNKPAATTDSKPSSGSSSYIGASAAKSKAFSHAGVKAANVRDLDCELDRDDGKVRYEVDFSCNGWEYEYEIDATTGAVLRSHKERDD